VKYDLILKLKNCGYNLFHTKNDKKINKQINEQKEKSSLCWGRP